LEKRAKDRVPDGLLDIVDQWARHDPHPEADTEGDLFGHGWNSNRGVALDSLCTCAFEQDPPQIERVFSLLETAVADSTSAVRAVAIYNLRFLLGTDAERALDLFERALEGRPELLGAMVSQHFVHAIYPTHLSRVLPTITAMLNSTNEKAQEAGAILACLAALTDPEANDLAEQTVTGNPVQRRYAAKVYAQNAGSTEVWPACEGGLRRLMDDEDEQVLQSVGSCFMHMHPEDIEDARSFITDFLKSAALTFGADHLARYLRTTVLFEPELALRVTAAILDADDAMSIAAIKDTLSSRGRVSRAISREDVPSMVLGVYNNASDDDVKSETMDLFERLLRAGSYAAYEALIQSDRR
jgi:hypothetical protein